MGKIFFVSEDPTNTVSRYSTRISSKVWQSYFPVIKRHYQKGSTRREILNELSKHHFNPSFGQLVAQMIRWGLARSSKPLPILQEVQPQLPTVKFELSYNECEILPQVLKDIPPGIMGVSCVLLAIEPVPLVHQNDSVNTSCELNQLMSDLHMNSDSMHQPIGSDESLVIADQNHGRRRQLLDAADVLFLGESYAHAYHTYRDAYRLQLSSSQTNFEEEQLYVQALISCIKSAATNKQREESIDIAQQFLDHLTLTEPSKMDSTSESAPLRLRHAFETWDDGDCATSKAVFDLLATYKSHRHWTTTQEITWAHRTTVHEWMCMRLVRVPRWQDIVKFHFHSSPFGIAYNGQLEPSAIFDVDNLTSILQWTATAFSHIGHWYDEQLSILRAASDSTSCPSPSTSTSHIHALLFWRLAFFSKHSTPSPNYPPRPCPELRVRLSTDIVFTAHSLQTASVVAHILLDGDRENVSSSSSSATHVQKLRHMQAALELPRLEEMEGWVFSLFWSGLKAKLAPSFARRYNDDAVSS